mmetsp:Transcript_36978/g.68249  ORF Transcript_36978/g.68249 Transcript_36978/m.68249 type:complete len:86 (-) Transcript_36978:444-701(-)
MMRLHFERVSLSLLEYSHQNYRPDGALYACVGVDGTGAAFSARPEGVCFCSVAGAAASGVFDSIAFSAPLTVLSLFAAGAAGCCC